MEIQRQNGNNNLIAEFFASTRRLPAAAAGVVIYIEDDIWTKGIKVVLQSVHTHSDTQPGDREYLSFLQNFVV